MGLRITEPLTRVEYSNPEAVVKFTLHTQEGIRVQSRNFNIISRALFNLTNNSRALERLGTKYSGAIERTLKAVNEVIDMPEKELENNIAILNRAVKEEERSSLNEVGYTHPKEHEVRIRTPQALRVIRIIQNFDKLHQIIDTLWLNNCFNQDEVEEFKSRLHNLIRDLAASLKRHAQASADELNQANGRAAEKNWLEALRQNLPVDQKQRCCRMPVMKRMMIRMRPLNGRLNSTKNRN